MSQIRRFKHRTGSFSGFSAGASYVEVVCAEISLVFPDGHFVLLDHLSLADVDSFVDMGWWVEIT